MLLSLSVNDGSCSALTFRLSVWIPVGWMTTNALCSCWILLVCPEFWSHHRSINMSVDIWLFLRTLEWFYVSCMETSCPARCNHGAEMLWNHRAVCLVGFYRFAEVLFPTAMLTVFGLFRGSDVTCKPLISSSDQEIWMQGQTEDRRKRLVYYWNYVNIDYKCWSIVTVVLMSLANKL